MTMIVICKKNTQAIQNGLLLLCILSDALYAVPYRVCAFNYYYIAHLLFVTLLFFLFRGSSPLPSDKKTNGAAVIQSIYNESL